MTVKFTRGRISRTSLSNRSTNLLSSHGQIASDSLLHQDVSYSTDASKDNPTSGVITGDSQQGAQASLSSSNMILPQILPTTSSLLSGRFYQPLTQPYTIPLLRSAGRSEQDEGEKKSDISGSTEGGDRNRSEIRDESYRQQEEYVKQNTWRGKEIDNDELAEEHAGPIHEYYKMLEKMSINLRLSPIERLKEMLFRAKEQWRGRAIFDHMRKWDDPWNKDKFEGRQMVKDNLMIHISDLERQMDDLENNRVRERPEEGASKEEKLEAKILNEIKYYNSKHKYHLDRGKYDPNHKEFKSVKKEMEGREANILKLESMRK